MIRELMHDPIFLARRSTPAQSADKAIAEDLADTLRAHRENCAGMAANMIGCTRRIIAFWEGDAVTVLWNPTIVKHEEPYDTAEGCLSLCGDPRKVKRYRKITVVYEIPAREDDTLIQRTRRFSGFTAQVIQHEIDHCDGVLI